MNRLRHVVVPLLLAGLLAGCGSRTAQQVAEPGGWSTAPDGPLSPRHSALVVTVGDEVLVLGGDATPVCPPAASCVDPPRYLRDGAAYAPATRTWRRLAESPVDPSSGSAAVHDGRVHVLTDQGLHVYDVAGDTWSGLPAPPRAGGRLLSAGDHLLRYEPTQEDGRIRPDHLYDPAARTWRALPPDPLVPSFDRGAVWTGERIVLLGKPEPPPPVDGVDSPTLFMHAATFDPATWTWQRVPQRDEVLGFGTDYAWTGDRVLLPWTFDYRDGGRNPAGAPEPTGGLLDPGTGEWERLPTPPEKPSTPLRVSAASPELTTAGEGLVLDLPAGRWWRLEPAPGAATEGVAGTWLGRRLVVFGGGTVSGQTRALSAATHVWTPGA